VNQAAGALDHLYQCFLVTEVLKQRDDVRESFVKSGRVRTSVFEKILSLPVNERVRCFVDDNVVRQTREDGLTWQVVTGVCLAGREVAEYYRSQVLRIKGICLLHRVGKHSQASLVRIAGATESPARLAPKCEFESSNRFAGDGINHLLMKPGIRFARIETATQHHLGIVKIDRVVINIIAAIVIDYLNVFADRTGS